MSYFEQCLAFTLKWEGGLSDHVSDAGGLTKYGISQRSYPRLDIINLTLEKAKLIYLRDYFEPINGNNLPDPVALVMFDMAVHSGARTAAITLQRVLNVAKDGIIGPKTIQAVQRKNPIQLALEVLDARINHLCRLVSHNPSQLAFLYGWMRRTHDLAFELGKQ